MRRTLLATTAILVFASPTVAQDITTARTTPATTSTSANGAPGNLRITSTGSVVVGTGTAVTMDSNHNVTNEGTVRITNANGAVGISANAGTTGDISNSGTITIDESYAPADGDNDGDLDGPLALGSGRYGIRTLGAHTGAISNAGTITVEGDNSYGIALGGPLTGAFTHNGTTSVTGNDSVGVALANVTGNVRLAGSITGKGEDAIGAQLAGDITGRLVVQGTVAATGYRTTTAPANTSTLDADDLLQGGIGLLVEGNVTGGIVIAVPPRDADANNADEDADGIPDATEGSGNVQSFGAAPAMVIGATGRDIVIGPVAGTSPAYGLQVAGTVRGSGVYAGVNATGLQIGGRGGAVAIANGIGIAGTVGASSNGASATALRLGSGAQTPLAHVTASGVVEATAGNVAGATATAIRVETGAQVPAIRNAGKVRATSGAAGTAIAIHDLSGNVSLVENSGAITAAGATAGSGRNIAIDLSANNAGATVRQTLVGGGVTAPTIEGGIRFGSGSDVLDLADGGYKGTTTFGDGADRLALSGDALFEGTALFGAGADQLTLANSAVFNGLADFGGGADVLTIANSTRFAGTLANAASLAVNVTGGTLDITAPSAIGSLDMGASSILIATLDKTAGEGTFINVAGNATFADGAKVGIRFADIDNAEGSYAFLQAGSLTGAADLEISADMLPFLFKATLGIDALANRLSINIARRTAAELELNASQASAYGAVIAALGADEPLEDLFLAISNGEGFRAALGQMLPDHAGGNFEGLSLGLRTLARQQAEPTGPVFSYGGLDIILNAAVWNSGKDVGSTAKYDLTGLGFSAAAEVDTRLGAFGTAVSWVFNDHDQGSELASVYSDAYELALYWRGEFGGLTAFGRGSIGLANFTGERILRGQLGATAIERTAEGNWSGDFMTASGGLSYEGSSGSLFFRPAVTVDYLSLSENAYEDTGGGDGFNLIVEKRSSDELAVNGGMAVGIDFDGTGPGDSTWFRIEGEGGWRELVGGSLGATVAKFEGGTSFTLTPEQRDSGWYARLRAVGGGEMFELGGELGAEQREGDTALSLRGTLRMGF
ncbi:MAG TPA: autotransporter outer membrane beta-barrel domain-containing protein [Paracoccaceae bacterium]|nr:autotransporter outer membrane beta-barrel domain-containing protein [Paracoccaceae bacterium]